MVFFLTGLQWCWSNSLIDSLIFQSFHGMKPLTQSLLTFWRIISFFSPVRLPTTTKEKLFQFGAKLSVCSRGWKEGCKKAKSRNYESQEKIYFYLKNFFFLRPHLTRWNEEPPLSLSFRINLSYLRVSTFNQPHLRWPNWFLKTIC